MFWVRCHTQYDAFFCMSPREDWRVTLQSASAYCFNFTPSLFSTVSALEQLYNGIHRPWRINVQALQFFSNWLGHNFSQLLDHCLRKHLFLPKTLMLCKMCKRKAFKQSEASDCRMESLLGTYMFILFVQLKYCSGWSYLDGDGGIPFYQFPLQGNSHISLGLWSMLDLCVCIP